MHAIKLNQDTERQLATMAAAQKTTMDKLIKNAIQELLDDWEDIQAARTALNNPHARYYSNEEAAQELGL